MVSVEKIRGNHFDRLPDDNMRHIGGPVRRREIAARMDALEPDLELCPFCGGQAVIDGKWAYTTPGVAVRCSRCRCSTPVRLEGLNLANGVAWTLEERIQEAAEMWNRRAAV